jgi:hypothetical protein
MRRPPFSFLHRCPLVLVMLACTFAACYESGNETGAEDALDDSSDLQVGEEDGLFDASDLGDGLDDSSDLVVDDAYDWLVDRETPASCECLNPLDECDESEGTCVRRDYTCNAIQGCDPGYECVEPEMECRCIDPEICGIDCSRTGFCPESWRLQVCAPDGRCRPALPCLSNLMCQDGQLCILSAGDYYTCAPAGTGGLGAPCSENTDCLEGVCETGVCLHRCLINADCEPGFFCGDTRNGQLGCMVSTDCSDCTAPDQYCWAASRCRTGNCLTSADCSSDCILEPHDPTIDAGECGVDGVPPQCEEDEFMLVLWFDHCFAPKACWSDNDCSAPYSCEPHRFIDGTGICGRAL